MIKRKIMVLHVIASVAKQSNGIQGTLLQQKNQECKFLWIAEPAQSVVEGSTKSPRNDALDQDWLNTHFSPQGGVL